MMLSALLAGWVAGICWLDVLDGQRPLVCPSYSFRSVGTCAKLDPLSGIEHIEPFDMPPKPKGLSSENPRKGMSRQCSGVGPNLYSVCNTTWNGCIDILSIVVPPPRTAGVFKIVVAGDATGGRLPYVFDPYSADKFVVWSKAKIAAYTSEVGSNLSFPNLFSGVGGLVSGCGSFPGLSHRVLSNFKSTLEQQDRPSAYTRCDDAEKRHDPLCKRILRRNKGADLSLFAVSIAFLLAVGVFLLGLLIGRLISGPISQIGNKSNHQNKR